MSQLDIQILHQDYLLTCPDGREAQLLEAVERVDQQFQAMRDTSKLRSRERVGVLLAVNLAYENLELRNQLQALQQQLAAGQGEADMAQTELDAADRDRLHALQAQVQADQDAAQQLLARLDQVLSEKTMEAESEPAPMPAPVQELAATETAAIDIAADAFAAADAATPLVPLAAADEAVLTEAAPSTDFNNTPDMGLPQTTTKSA